MNISNLDYVKTCLSYIDPNLPRQDWVSVGMAIQHELGDDVGYDVFKQWSMGGDSFNSRQFESTWKSLKQGYDTFKMGTLVYFAKSGGFDPKSMKAPKQHDPAEAARIAAERQKAYEKKREEDAQKAAAAREIASKRWNKSPPINQTNPHPYLEKKGCTNPVGPIKQYKNFLQIPAFNKEGILTTLLSINSTGFKSIIKDSELSGSSMTIGKRQSNQDKPILLCEGWATGQSIYQGSLVDHPDTGLQVVVAFNSHNLIHVAQNIREHYPSRGILICADNDCRNKNNDGVLAARKTKKAVGNNIEIIFPQFPEQLIDHRVKKGESVPTDFNDLHLISGLTAVASYIKDGMNTLEKKKFLESNHSDNLEM